MASNEWRLDLFKDLAGEVSASLYEVDNAGQWALIDSDVWGPTDTATDVATWFVRHWAGRARFPLR